MKFQIASTTKGEWHVHRAGCADVERTLRKRSLYNGTPWTVEAANVQEAVEKDCDEELREMGYSAADWRIFPCCYDKQDEAPVQNAQATQEPTQETEAVMAQGTTQEQTRDQSAAISPVVLAWEIAFENVNRAQREVVQLCIAAGIAPGTAKTQVSRFFNQQRDPDYSWK